MFEGLPLGLIVGAAGGLFTAVVADRFFLSPRVRADSTNSARAPTEESTVPENHGHGRPGRVHGQGGAAHGHGNAVSAAATRAPAPPLDTYMPAIEHIERFVAWLVIGTNGRPCTVRQRFDAMHDLYLEWCGFHFVSPLPEKSWQTLMKKHEQVSHKREPMRDPATGRILRKSSGAPERETFYTVKPARARPVLPGKVPVADLVPAARINPPPGKRARQPAAAADEQPWQPLQRVA